MKQASPGFVQLSKKVKRLERKLAGIQRRTKTLYHRTYAFVIRRKHMETIDHKSVVNLKYWIGKAEKHQLRWTRKLGTLEKNLKKGRMLITLSPKEYRLLKSKLKGRCSWRTAREYYKRGITQCNKPRWDSYDGSWESYLAHRSICPTRKGRRRHSQRLNKTIPLTPTKR